MTGEGRRAGGARVRREGVRIAAAALAALAFLGVVAAGVAAGERWGWLGVRIRDLTEREMEEITLKQGVREGYGVVIADVLKDTPAAASALKAGDLVVAVAGRPVVETRELQRIVGAAAVGQELSLVVLRDEGRQEVKVRVGQMPPDIVAERIAAEFGFAVREPSADDGEGAPPARTPVIGAVAEGSPAQRGGLAVGDRLVGLDGREIASLEDFRRRVVDHLLRDELRLVVDRKGRTLGLVLPPADAGPAR